VDTPAPSIAIRKPHFSRLISLSLKNCRFPHNQVACQKHCSRLLECGHPCTQLCNAECKSDCICCAVDELDTPVKAITLSPKKKLGRSESSPSTKQKQPRTSSQHDRLALEDLHELCRNSAPASQDLHQNIGPFRDYAAGGHVDSDNSFAMIAENESLEARQKRLDDETFAALFGETDAPGLAKSKDNVSLVRTKQDGEGGTRGIWKGTFEVPQANSIRPKDEMSLLDLL